MKHSKITINENGVVSVPDNVMMQDFEIAELFDVMIPTVRANIRAILKSGIVTADAQGGGAILGNTLYPDYYRLDMVVALAFRIQSRQAEILRRWILGKVTKAERSMINQPVFISVDKSINRLIN